MSGSHEHSEFKQCDPGCPGWAGLPSATPPEQPPVVVDMEKALAQAPREELVCFARTLLIAIRTGEPVTMRVAQAEGAEPREFVVVAAELSPEVFHVR